MDVTQTRYVGYRLLTKEGFAEAKIHLEKAVELDPDFARAYAALAVLYWKAVLTPAPQGLSKVWA